MKCVCTSTRPGSPSRVQNRRTSVTSPSTSALPSAEVSPMPPTATPLTLNRPMPSPYESSHGAGDQNNPSCTPADSFAPLNSLTGTVSPPLPDGYQLPPGHQPGVQHHHASPASRLVSPARPRQRDADRARPPPPARPRRHPPRPARSPHPRPAPSPVSPNTPTWSTTWQDARSRDSGQPPSPTARACRSSTSAARSAADPGSAARTARLSAYGIRSGTPSAARSSSSVRRAAISGPTPSQLKATAPCSSSRAEPRSSAVMPTLVIPGPNHARYT